MKMVSSDYRGVHSPSRAGRKRRFLAKIGHGGKLIYIGSFDTETQAALAYDKKALELKGYRAILNFDSSRERFSSSMERGNLARQAQEQREREQKAAVLEHERKVQERRRQTLLQQHQRLISLPSAMHSGHVLMRVGVAPISPQHVSAATFAAGARAAAPPIWI